eukprot:TRINITY_DN4341_c0_g3_i1.p1 TRINITY_DN4341_c0_g3~~TRINITY_DN4341_c0_g3_i1.p1  ORF type:complete len:588 (-),score=121.50 TRINITY_DN4341_c0_g3_i1:61-1824(-)
MPWVAASLLSGGWCHKHSNFDEEQIEGNTFRHLWYHSCYHISESEDLHPLERAIYAKLCGSLNQSLFHALCPDWEDQLWINCACLSLYTAERALLEENKWTEERLQTLRYLGQQQQIQNLTQPPFGPPPFSSIAEAFPVDRLDKESDPMVFAYHQFQRLMILKDWSTLIQVIHKFATEQRQQCPSDFIRFAVHVVILLSDEWSHNKVDELFQHEKFQKIRNDLLNYYIDVLKKNNEYSCIAKYVSRLIPEESRAPRYAQIIQDISDTRLKFQCLEDAKNCGLDINRIARNIVISIQKETEEYSLGPNDEDLNSKLTEQDEKKLKSIEWLTYDSTQYVEAIRKLNALVREFLSDRKESVAQRLVGKSFLVSMFSNVKHLRETYEELARLDPYTTEEDFSVGLLKKGFSRSQQERQRLATFEENALFENAVKEYSSWQAYFAVISANASWQDAFRSSRSSVDRPLAEVFLAKKSTDVLTSAYNLLRMHGGWLVDVAFVPMEGEKGRIDELILLRTWCIPRVVQTLQGVLLATHQYQESLTLVDLVADEELLLYSTFTNEQMQQFLEKVAQTAIELESVGHSFPPVALVL